MKRRLLHRYERDASGRVVIDVSTSRVEALYSDFDRKAPYIRRDLDQNLVDYLIECADEIGRVPFVIRFTLEEAPRGDRLSRIRHSVRGYFDYLHDGERRKIRLMYRNAFVLATMGLGLFCVAIWLGGQLGAEPSVFENLMSEGLTVAAWVALWESLAKFVIEWPAYRSNLDRFERLSLAPLAFETKTSGPETDIAVSGEPAASGGS